MKRLFKKMMAGLIIAIASNVAFALDCSFTTDPLGEVCFKHSGHSVSATAKHLHAGKIVDGAFNS